jgi:hypothetical protein
MLLLPYIAISREFGPDEQNFVIATHMTLQTFPHPYSVSDGPKPTAVIAITETCDSSH